MKLLVGILIIFIRIQQFTLSLNSSNANDTFLKDIANPTEFLKVNLTEDTTTNKDIMDMDENDMQDFTMNMTDSDIAEALIGANYTADPIAFMAQIRFKNETLYGSATYCGGALINNAVVVTAAYCMFKNLITGYPEYVKEENIKVVVGSEARFEAGPSTAELSIKNLAYHYDYEPPDYSYDVAVLYLEKNVTLNDLTKPIQIIDKPLTAGMECTIYTFGQFWPAGPWPDKLLKIPVVIRNDRTCRRYFKTIDYGVVLCFETVKKYYMGAYFCNGQYGNPVVCNGQLAGVVSHGEPGCKKSKFAVMANTYHLRRWLEVGRAGNMVLNNVVAFLCFEVFLVL